MMWEGGSTAGQLLALGKRSIATRFGEFDLVVARCLQDQKHVLALSMGDLRGEEPVLARVHSSCVTSESYGGCDCDCVEQLGLALKAVAARGRGVVFYLMQEGRGAGILAKARDRMMVQASGNRIDTFEAYEQMALPHDLRSYEEVGWMAKLLGLEAPLELLTNNPEKARGVASSAGCPVVATQSLDGQASPWNRDYLASKSRSGHGLEDPGLLDGAALPGPVDAFEPYCLPGQDRFVRVASYFLPVRDFGTAAAAAHSVCWFRLHAYLDLEERAAKVLLALDEEAGGTPQLHVQGETLLRRFPLAACQPDSWAVKRAGISAGGPALIGFVAPRGFSSALTEVPGDPEGIEALMELHLARPRRDPCRS
jgi:GTP cyclohydrolase II